MRYSNHKFTCLLATIALLATACQQQGPTSDVVIDAPVVAQEKAKVVILASENDRHDVLFSMPTPNELFQLINGMGKTVSRHALYDTDLLNTAVTTNEKAFRFGLCVTDLIYASHTGLNSEVARYYLVNRQLAEDLGIENTFSTIDVRRLEKNLANGDSLTIIGDEAYLKAYAALDATNRGDLLAFMLAGGWVESTYLLVETINEFDPNEPLLDRLVEQQHGLSQLVELTEINSGSDEMILLRSRLLALRDVFDHIPVTRIKQQPDESRGRRVLGGEETFELTAMKFEDIREAVTTLRGVNPNF